MNPEILSDEFIETYFHVLTLIFISKTDKLHLVNPSVTHVIKAVYAFEEYLEPQNYIDNNYLILQLIIEMRFSGREVGPTELC